MAAADAWKIYDLCKEKMSDGTIDMDDASAGIFKCALFTSTLTPAAADTLYSGLSNEVTQQYGYLTGGEALTSVTWADTAGTTKWDAADIVWSASGGDITARYAIIYHVASSALMAMSILDGTPADVTATDGNDLTIELSASGIFTVTGGWA